MVTGFRIWFGFEGMGNFRFNVFFLGFKGGYARVGEVVVVSEMLMVRFRVAGEFSISDRFVGFWRFSF